MVEYENINFENRRRKRSKVDDELNSSHINKFLKINNSDLKRVPIRKDFKSTLWKETHDVIVKNQISVNQLSFLQKIRCNEVVNNYKINNNIDESDEIACNFSYCRDCIENFETDCCRFLGWRKLILNQNKQIEVSGFLEENDADENDLKLWTHNTLEYNRQSKVDNDIKIKIINQVGDSFVKLVDYELKMHDKFKNGIIWKRIINGIRELCDICKTSIFNGHLACLECGFAICLDCYQEQEKIDKDKKTNETKLDCLTKINGSDNSSKLKIKKIPHEPADLVYVQFIPRFILCSVYEEFRKFKKCQVVKKETIQSGANNNLDSNRLIVLDVNQKLLFENFESEWLNKKPILIKNNHLKMNADLWSPDSFRTEFGDLTVDLINCRNGQMIYKQKMSDFWNGFEDFDSRIRDRLRRPIICKLKDWPTTDDFKNVLESRYNDLMANLPIPDYSDRDGLLNLSSYLPDSFLKPDLGPKMYIAYSSADTPKDGTTSLHIDISDAVNIMMYVGGEAFVASEKPEIKKGKKKAPKKLIGNEDKNTDLNEAIFEILKGTKCDKAQLKRFKNGEKPGALWHIFKPEDADLIRTYFTTKRLKNGMSVNEKNDAIHDQTNYIDDKILADMIDFGIQMPFIIIQFLGDAIFIPSGAPHQVRNLNSCIKIAGDFVSPNGVEQCIKITDEFRKLSDSHLNKEDKLQIKNILYHSVKESLKNLKYL